MDRSVAFKEAVWRVIRRKRTALFLTEHPRLAPLFQPIHETVERVRRWYADLGPDEEDPTQEYFIHDIYEHMFDQIRTNSCNQAGRVRFMVLLFDVYRAMQRGNELDPYFKDRCLEQAMLAFHDFGIKLNAKLHPENPDDKRTLFYTYLLGLQNSYRHSSFLRLQKICEFLTPEERSAEVLALQNADEFVPWFEREKHELEKAAWWSPFCADVIRCRRSGGS